jgi:hypothetical protein
MNRIIALLALLSCVACVYSGDPSLGSCNVPADCTRRDGGALLGATCNEGRCSYSCKNVCDAAETCDGTNCVLVGPRVTQVNAPTTWSLPSQNVTVTAVVDDTPKTGTTSPGIASAALRIAGKQDIAGTTNDTGLSRTYTFTVPGSVQATPSETPVNFTIVAVDLNGGATPEGAVGTGQLLIDALGPNVNGVTVNGGVTAGAPPQVKWFSYAATGDIDLQATITDSGSGVDPATLQLIEGANRFDHGTPTCGAGQTAQQQVCHFTVAKSYLGAGNQARIQFAVAGRDKTGNAIAANSAALGLDGKPPAITFTVGNAGDTTKTANYPDKGFGCNGNVIDTSVYCGHDGSHFWRRGEPATAKLLMTINDGNDGSGANASAGAVTYCFASTSTATSCTTTPGNATQEAGNTFSIPADFANAPFTSDAAGAGQVWALISAHDAVDNLSASATRTAISITRVKWMRTTAGKVDSFKGSPVVTAGPPKQIILAGTELDGATCTPASACGPLISLRDDGTMIWRAGRGDVDKIGTNVVYSSTTKQLYVVVDPAVSATNTNKMFAYHIGSTGVDGSFNCAMVQVATPGKVFGSPALLIEGGAEYALVADQTLHRLWAFSGAPGVGCSSVFTNGVLPGNSTAWAGVIQSPSVNGQTNSIHVGHGTTVTPGLSRVSFSGGNFAADSEAPSFAPHVTGTVAIATNIFFGDSAAGKYFSYDAAALTANSQWAGTAGAMLDALTSPPLVSASYVLGAAGSGDGRLRAFNRIDGTQAFEFPPSASSALGAFGTAAIDNNNMIYASQSSGPSLLVIASNGSALAPGWSAYQGSAGTAPDTTVDSVTTEPTLDATGVMYFATLGGKAFALITDSAGPLAPVAGTTWPRTGYDNCNSSNTSFNCQ